MQVEWKPVVGYEGFYSVSSLGEVRRDAGGPGCVVGRIMRIRHTKGRYPYLSLHRDGKSRACLLHRLVAEAFIGPRPAGMQIDHLDGDKGNARPSNLEYVTPETNNRRASVMGLKASGDRHWTHIHPETVPRGELNGNSRHTVEHVVAVRSARSSGLSYKKIAELTGFGKGWVADVVSGKIWGHV